MPLAHFPQQRLDILATAQAHQVGIEQRQQVDRAIWLGSLDGGEVLLQNPPCPTFQIHLFQLISNGLE